MHYLAETYFQQLSITLSPVTKYFLCFINKRHILHTPYFITDILHYTLMVFFKFSFCLKYHSAIKMVLHTITSLYNTVNRLATIIDYLQFCNKITLRASINDRFTLNTPYLIENILSGTILIHFDFIMFKVS